MDAGVIPETGGELVPLTAGSGPIDHAIKGATGINTGSSHPLGRVEMLYQTIHHLPQIVGNFPDGGQSLGF